MSPLALSIIVAQDPRRRTIVYAAAALALISLAIFGALAFQAAGFAPCELCLKERLPYYAGRARAATTVFFASRASRPAALVGFALLAMLFLFSAGFGTYHAGVEWGLWPGPGDCTGTPQRAADNADFLRQLEAVRVVRCDAVAIRILGLSLAGWNALVSLGIVVLCALGLTSLRRR